MNQRTTEDVAGITERLIMAMACDMADAINAIQRTCTQFKTLAHEWGVNVSAAFED